MAEKILQAILMRGQTSVPSRYSPVFSKGCHYNMHGYESLLIRGGATQNIEKEVEEMLWEVTESNIKGE